MSANTSLPPSAIDRLKELCEKGCGESFLGVRCGTTASDGPSRLFCTTCDQAFYAALPALLSERERYQWQPIETAPKDGTEILGLCVHDTQTECCPEGGQCVYHYHADAVGHCQDGPHVIEFGGGDSDYDEFRGVWYHTPPSWFVTGTDMEMAANPTHWMPLPATPAPQPGEGL